MVFGGVKQERNPEQLVFHPECAEEYNVPQQMGGFPIQFGTRPRYRSFLCGACGREVTGRILCDVKRPDGATLIWCMCPQKDPTVIVEKDGAVVSQFPHPNQYHANSKWPSDVRALYEEAAKSFSAGAYTACAMVCRKLLMVTACAEGDSEGKSFLEYVDYITNKVLNFPRAKTHIDRIRVIANDATHKIAFVAQSDAQTAIEVVTYMLDTIYPLPAA